MKQVIVVTGASSGFGALAARALAEVEPGLQRVVDARPIAERMIGDDIAEEGIKFLQSVNFGEQSKIVRIAAE